MKHVLMILALSTLFSCTQQSGPTVEPGGSTFNDTGIENLSPGYRTVGAPIWKPAPVALESSCPAKNTYRAVDLSEPVTTRFLTAMHQLGVDTVFRYYDWEQETIKNKTLKMIELQMLMERGFSVGVVFQHHNSSLSTFTTQRGVIDSIRSRELAANVHQPKGSPIYFGVDGDWPAAADQAKVKAYFQALAPSIRGAGFKIGVYGSGQTCNALKKAGLADFCWLAQSSGFTDTAAVAAAKNYSMKQGMPRNCGGINVDFNATIGNDFGQWRAQL